MCSGEQENRISCTRFAVLQLAEDGGYDYCFITGFDDADQIVAAMYETTNSGVHD
jgi:hypothetical protein